MKAVFDEFQKVHRKNSYHPPEGNLLIEPLIMIIKDEKMIII
jgi:hypothetical protein